MKKGIVIGAGKDAIHIIKLAKAKGIYVIGLDGNKNAEGLKYVDEARIVDISNVSLVSEIVSSIKPDFAIPIPIGRYLSTLGYVNSHYGLKGIEEEPTINSTDKYLFHKVLNNLGLRNVKLYLLDEKNKKSNTEYIISYPAIIKPRFGSGSRDVYYLENTVDLDKAINKIKNIEEDFILEEAAVGEEYSVDGAIINGELYITLLRKKIITPLPIRQPISSFSVINNKENLQLHTRVFNHINKVIKALKYDNCLLNADLIINDKEIFVIEIAPRPSGHNLHNVFVPEATGIDIGGEYLNYLMDKKFNFVPSKIKTLQIRFFDFEDKIVKKVPNFRDLIDSGKCNIIKWECNIKDGDYMNKIINGHSIMDRGFFIVEGKNERDLVSQSDWILKQFKLC